MALTKIEKKYLTLAGEKLFRENNNITEDNLKVLAEEIGKSTTLVRNYINSLTFKPEKIDGDILPSQPQTNLRLIMSGNSAGGRDGFTVMSDAASSLIEGTNKASSTPNKHDKVIYRGNPRPKR